MKPALSILPEREAVETDPRRTFTPMQKAKMLMRAKRRCEVIVDENGVPVPGWVKPPATARRCNRYIRSKWTAGHFPLPWALGGRTTLDNGRVECPECAKHTQSDDTTTAAKCERISGRKGQWARKKRRGPVLKGGRKLEGQGFDKRFKKRMDGKVEKRT